MLHIRNFMDKMASMEARQSKDVVLPMVDARGLRDDIAKLLSDLYELKTQREDTQEVIEIQVKGGSFK